MKVSDLNFDLLLEKDLNFFAIKREIETHIKGVYNKVKKVNVGVLNTITTATEKLLLKIVNTEQNTDLSVFEKIDLEKKFIYQTAHIIERLEQIRAVYLENVFEKTILHSLVKHIDDLIYRLRAANHKLVAKADKNPMQDIEDELNADMEKNGEKGRVQLGTRTKTHHVPVGLANDLETRKLVINKK